MKQDMVPVFTVLLEGDNNTICKVLHPWPFAYEAWLDTRMNMFEDDPETASGSIIINTIYELAQVLSALTTNGKTHITDLRLYVNAGAPVGGYSAQLNEKDRRGTWQATEGVITERMAAALADVRYIASAVKEGKEWQHPTQPCLDATDMWDGSKSH